MLRIGFVVRLMIGVYLAAAGTACVGRSTVLEPEIITIGPVRASFRDAAGNPVAYVPLDSDVDGADQQRFWLDGGGPFTARFVVQQEGPTAISIGLRRVAGKGGSGLLRDDHLDRRSLFIVTEPPGTQLEVTFSSRSRASELRLRIDRGADGNVDAEQPPVAAVSSDGLLNHLVREAVSVAVEPSSSGEARVTLTPAAAAPSLAGVYYSLYPTHPRPQLYQGPFIAPTGSFLLFGAFDATGAISATREMAILGDTTPEAQATIEVDGPSTAIRTSAPGQNATVAFTGRRGERIELVISHVSGGVRGCCAARLSLVDPASGTLITPLQIRPLGATDPGTRKATLEYHLAAELPLDGVYTIQLDPLLANTLDAIVSVRTAR